MDFNGIAVLIAAVVLGIIQIGNFIRAGKNTEVVREVGRQAEKTGEEGIRVAEATAQDLRKRLRDIQAGQNGIHILVNSNLTAQRNLSKQWEGYALALQEVMAEAGVDLPGKRPRGNLPDDEYHDDLSAEVQQAESKA